MKTTKKKLEIWLNGTNENITQTIDAIKAVLRIAKIKRSYIGICAESKKIWIQQGEKLKLKI